MIRAECFLVAAMADAGFSKTESRLAALKRCATQNLFNKL
jgi:hypothetical protein